MWQLGSILIPYLFKVYGINIDSSLGLRALTMVSATPIPAFAYCSFAIASAASQVFVFINPELWYYTGITGAVSANLSSLVFFE